MRLSTVEPLHDDWMQLSNYHWPGNVQELCNVVERTLLSGHLPYASFAWPSRQGKKMGSGYRFDYDLEMVEYAHIEARSSPCICE